MSPHKNDPAALAQPESSPVNPQAGKNGSPSGGCEQGYAAEELTYDPVPPKKTITVSVRYRIGGRGRPLPYPLDEGDEE
jgi:hypothetical protein